MKIIILTTFRKGFAIGEEMTFIVELVDVRTFGVNVQTRCAPDAE